MAPRNLVLAGFMGTGKTSVGRLLAERLGWAFVDMDEVLAKRLRMSIAEVFPRLGEARFRAEETALLGELACGEEQVIATGGGALLTQANRSLLEGHAVIFCLNCGVDRLLSRLPDDGARPLLGGPEREKRVRDLLAQRSAAYTAIAHQIDTTDRSVAEVVEAVLETWRTLGKNQIGLGKGKRESRSD